MAHRNTDFIFSFVLAQITCSKQQLYTGYFHKQLTAQTTNKASIFICLAEQQIKLPALCSKYNRFETTGYFHTQLTTQPGNKASLRNS
jgi:hypothetical protein